MILLVSLAALAAPPLDHAGRALDGDGAPLNGAHTVRLELFDGPAGGTLLHDASIPVELADGYYQVRFTGIPDAAMTAADLRHRLSIDGAVLVEDAPFAAAVDAWRARALDAGAVRAAGGTLTVDTGGTLELDGATARLTDSNLIVTGGDILFDDESRVTVGAPVVSHNGRYTLDLVASSSTNSSWTAVVDVGEGQSYFVEIQAAFSHCGGGCHWTWREWTGFFNAYLVMQQAANSAAGSGDAGTWTFTRVDSNANGVGDRLHITKSAGNTSLNFGGDVTIRIESTKPLSLISP